MESLTVSSQLLQSIFAGNAWSYKQVLPAQLNRLPTLGASMLGYGCLSDRASLLGWLVLVWVPSVHWDPSSQRMVAIILALCCPCAQAR